MNPYGTTFKSLNVHCAHFCALHKTSPKPKRPNLELTMGLGITVRAPLTRTIQSDLTDNVTARTIETVLNRDGPLE